MNRMTQFRVTYDGDALANHEMDARELAPALLAVADLLEASVRALHGDRARAQVKVKGSFSTGSFSVDFTTAVDLLRVARDFLAGNEMAAVANATAVLGLLGLVTRQGRSGLAQALIWLRGRPIVKVDMAAEGSATLHVEDAQCEIELDVLLLLRDQAVREAFSRMLVPLDQEGIDVFAAGSDTEVALRISSEERVYFIPPVREDELLLQNQRTMALSIISLAFGQGGQWRLSDGDSIISARICDDAFQADVNANEVAFCKGDELICDVRVMHWRTASGARTEYEVTRVLEHRRAARRVPLSGLALGPDRAFPKVRSA